MPVWQAWKFICFAKNAEWKNADPRCWSPGNNTLAPDSCDICGKGLEPVVWWRKSLFGKMMVHRCLVWAQQFGAIPSFSWFCWVSKSSHLLNGIECSVYMCLLVNVFLVSFKYLSILNALLGWVSQSSSAIPKYRVAHFNISSLGWGWCLGWLPGVSHFVAYTFTCTYRCV